jgi:hypothetical protein
LKRQRRATDLLALRLTFFRAVFWSECDILKQFYSVTEEAREITKLLIRPFILQFTFIISFFTIMLLLLSFACLASLVFSQDEICRAGEGNVFNVKVNMYAGEIGFFEFEECEGTSPTIGMEVGETYTFIQKDVTNYYHPLGFAYFADGKHKELPELEPTVSIPENAACATNTSCPAAMYYKNDRYLGVYKNLPGKDRVYDEDFGLDAYEPEFIFPVDEWATADYAIKLNFDDEAFLKDIFYFCHVSLENLPKSIEAHVILLADSSIHVGTHQAAEKW